MAEDTGQWHGQLVSSQSALERLKLEGTLVLDCSALPPSFALGGLATITAARYSMVAGGETGLERVVWVCSQRLLEFARSWRPREHSAEELDACGITVVLSEGPRDQLHASLQAATGSGSAAACLVVLPPQTMGGGTKTALRECLAVHSI